MKRLPALLLLCATFPLLLPADDDTKQVQQALKTQGFYYGDVDGAPSEETTEAIRRFQIRNGLLVTGKPDNETRKALVTGGEATTPSQSPAVEPPGIPQSPAAAQPLLPPSEIQVPTARPPSAKRPDLRADPSQTAPAPRNPGSSIPDASVTDGTTSYRGGSSIFNGGPFAGAPPFVQTSVLGQTQALLSREGFYNGPVDGLPGQRTAEALLAYQAAYGLPRSGRLDANTVRALGIAPVAEARAPRPSRPARPRYYEPPAPRQQGSGAYEGRIVPETGPR